MREATPAPWRPTACLCYAAWSSSASSAGTAGATPRSPQARDAASPFTSPPFHRNQLHLQRVQLQQALQDVRGGVEFAERLLTCGSEAEILSAKGVTLRRLSSLADGGCDPNPATVAADDDGGGGICFRAREPAGEVEGYPVVGVITSETVDLSRCTVDGEGEASSQPGVESRGFSLSHLLHPGVR